MTGTPIGTIGEDDEEDNGELKIPSFLRINRK